MMRHHYSPIRMAKKQKTTPQKTCGNTKCCEDAEKVYHSHTAGRNIKWHSHPGKKLSHDPATALLNIFPRKMKY